MKKIRIIVLTSIVYFFVCSIQIVLVYKYINPSITPLMVIRFADGVIEGRDSLEIKRKWKKLDEVSINVGYAVIASEDFTFFQHHGFNWKGIKRAIKFNKKHRGKMVRGGSTISQQTAKNVFLLPSRTWIRKGLEAYFTCLIELLWSKERILEVYLNVIEVGDGVYGVESGAEVYFRTTASELTEGQAASLAAILPSPLHRSPNKPSRFLNRKIKEIQLFMNMIKERPLEFPLDAFHRNTTLE